MDLENKVNQEAMKALGRGIRQALELKSDLPPSAEIERRMNMLARMQPASFDTRAADRSEGSGAEPVLATPHRKSK